MKILVTGGAGFIGSAFIRYILRTTKDVQVINYDALTYAGNLDNLKSVEHDERYIFIKGDICDKQAVLNALDGVDVVVNYAAESHNDNAVRNPTIFLQTNVVGTQVLLQACREKGIKRFHHISTCEVFGDLALEDTHAFLETDPFLPRTPYNASKAGANHVVMSYFHTFDVPVTISHCCNNYGPYQFPEKLIPLFATNALDDKPLPVMKSSENKREWIHADDHSAAVWKIIQDGKIGESYNIGTGIEKSVAEITRTVLVTLDKPKSLIEEIPDRLGHDRRYLLDSSKLRNELGWEPVIDFETGIRDTILWYKENRIWWERVKSGEYRNN
jgi:dTDP-glucose 4,6-dehydratase